MAPPHSPPPAARNPRASVHGYLLGLPPRYPISLSLVTVAVVVVVLGRRPRASYAPRCQKRSFFLSLYAAARYYHAPKFSSSQDAYTTLAKNGSRSIAFLFFLLISILMSCLAADLAVGGAKRFLIEMAMAVEADVDKERMRLGGEEGAGREGPRMQRTNFRPRSDEVKQYRTWVTQKGVGAFVHSPLGGARRSFFLLQTTK